MKKSIPKVRERESEASILGNDREREFPLTPAAVSNQVVKMNTGYCLNVPDTVDPRAITILQSRAEIHKTEILQERNIQSGHSLKDPYR